MVDLARLDAAVALLTLRRCRAILRQPFGRTLAALIGAVYGFIALLVGQMLVFGPSGYHTSFTEILTGSYSPAWWNYPALLVVGPGGVLALPFLPTVSMVIVSAGVGLGMAVGILLAARLLRDRREGLGTPTTVGSIAGLTPAMLALVTLGACCSTTAAATAGIGVVAQASGSSPTDLLLNNWYLNVFQIVVLWIALLAQEQILAAYGTLFGVTGEPPRSTPGRSRDPAVRSTVVRGGLIVAGAVWSLAMAAEWTGPSGASATPALVVQWLLQHQFIAFVAIASGFFATGVAGVFHRAEARWYGYLLRGALIATGASLATWVPPPIAGLGIFGWLNELLGAAGGPASWGAVAPPTLGVIGLGFRWGFQFLFLGVFAMLLGIAPARTLAWLSRGVDHRASEELVVPESAPQDRAFVPPSDPRAAVDASPLPNGLTDPVNPTLRA